MKRDFDLIRKILLQVEEEGDPVEPLIHSLSVEDFDQSIVNEHVKLLIDGGLLEGEYKYSTNNRILLTMTRGLTPRAYDFLDNIRNDALWARIQERVSTTTGAASFDIIEDFARQIVATVLARPKQE